MINAINRKILVSLSALVVGLALAALATTSRTGSAEAVTNLPPAAEEMRAFNAPALPTAAVPPVVAAEERSLPDSANLGEAVAGETRLLRSGLGKNRVRIYAFPTTKGGVCTVVTEATTIATCVPKFFPHQGYTGWSLYSGPSTPQTIAGIAADSVTAVEVVVNSRRVDADLKGNSFFWQSEDPALERKAVTALVVQQADGRVHTENLDFGNP